MTEAQRRNPEHYLEQLREQEEDRGKGRLKIFFGAVAGVGKTYGMLQAARALKNEGIDVLVGWVETHGREETAKLLEGLEQIPRKSISYQSKSFEEFDLDAALARKPEVILVDELAHTNITGSRHEKRWQDIQELLEHGIDVFTTVNVQHIESVRDIVAQITNVTVKERVPDSVLEKAFDIELVDLPPDELLQRLKEGKVYIPAQAKHAEENFFRKGNLIALRELALRFTAERVDAQMQEYRKFHRIHYPWPASETIIVCIGPSPLSARLVRAAKRMSNALRADWIVAFVDTGNMSQEAKDRVFQTMRLADQLGAQTIELTGNNVGDEIIKCASQYNATKVIIGKSRNPKWKDWLFGNLVDDVVRKSGPIDVYVITGDEAEKIPRPASYPKPVLRWNDYWKATAVMAVCTIVARLMLPFFELANVVMVYILGLVVVATRYGRGPSIFCAFLSVAAFDFFFVPPHHTFAVSDTQYLITFLVMLVIGLVISTLTNQVKRQEEAALLREHRTKALYSMSRELAAQLELDDILTIGMTHISDVFECRVVAFVPGEAGRLAAKPLESNPLSKDEMDIAVAEWCFKNNQSAGLNTSTLPAAKSLYLPLKGSTRAIGVLAVCPKNSDRFKSPEQLRLLETFANQTALACERALLSDEAESTRIRIKTEQLRNSLLSSVSHDLRTPLATITGSASGIMDDTVCPTAEDCRSLATEIYSESVRLNKLVDNLLNMTKLESGTMTLKCEWLPVDELVGSALAAIPAEMRERSISTTIENPLQMVFADGILVQQVLLNLLENAMKYSPSDSAIVIATSGSDEGVTFEVADRGPGIPQEHHQRVFEKFYRREPALATGVGLGLAICHGIVEAHGGKIWVEDRPGGGACFKFRLPVQSDPPVLYDSLSELEEGGNA